MRKRRFLTGGACGFGCGEKGSVVLFAPGARMAEVDLIVAGGRAGVGCGGLGEVAAVAIHNRFGEAEGLAAG